jgi:hypothetical protein
MNAFKNAQKYQMFMILMKQKWSEFERKIKDKFTVEIVIDVANASKYAVSWTTRSIKDFNVVQEWAKKRDSTNKE